MSRNATQVRINEINVILKRLSTHRHELKSTPKGLSCYGISEAIRVIGERKREIKTAPLPKETK